MKKIFCFITFSMILNFAIYAQKSEQNNSETITFDFSTPDSISSTKGTVTVVDHERNKFFYEKKIKQSKKKKIVGIILSSLGAGALFGTIAGVLVTKQNNPFGKNYISEEGRLILNIGLSSTFAFLGTGIPLSIIGSVKEKKYKKKLLSF